MIEKNKKDDLWPREEDVNTRTFIRIFSLVGQLGWITGQTRQDLAFEVCQMSSILNF